MLGRGGKGGLCSWLESMGAMKSPRGCHGSRGVSADQKHKMVYVTLLTSQFFGKRNVVENTAGVDAQHGGRPRKKCVLFDRSLQLKKVPVNTVKRSTEEEE